VQLTLWARTAEAGSTTLALHYTDGSSWYGVGTAPVNGPTYTECLFSVEHPAQLGERLRLTVINGTVFLEDVQILGS
jgi:hypothetical protein